MQIQNKHILVPGQRYQDSSHLLQNSKVSKNVMGFNNHAQRSSPPVYLDVDNHFKGGPTSMTFYNILRYYLLFYFSEYAFKILQKLERKSLCKFIFGLRP